MAEQAGYIFEAESLTPGYSDGDGHEVTSLTNFRLAAEDTGGG